MSQQWSRIAALMKTNSVGLDISDRTIEIVALSEEGGGAKIGGMSRALLPRGVVVRGRIKNEQKLAEALAAAVKNARPEPITPKKITFGIPEGQMYTRVFELAEHKREDRDRLVEEEMQASIPLQKDDALYTYTTLYESPRLTGIILIAASKAVMAEWQALFRRVGFDVEMYESETLAVARGLFQGTVESPVCIADIGGAATTISVFSKQGLRYLQTLSEAGDMITLALAEQLGIPPKDAEQRKIKDGLSGEKNKDFFIIAKILQTIAARVKASIDYFQDKTGERVDRVVLIGGTAKLKGIKEYFTENLNTSVWLGESVILRNQAFLEYVEAAGLALRGLHPEKYARDPSFADDAAKSADESEKSVFSTQPLISEQETAEAVVIAPIQFVHAPATRLQKIVLLAVLASGIAGVFAGAQLRERIEASLGKGSPPTAPLRETGIQILNETVPLTLSSDAGAFGTARGEIFETEITEASGYSDAIARARADAAKTAGERGKTLWQEPINKPADITNITFPLRVQWLFYSHEEITDRLFERVREKTGVDVRGLSPYVTVLNITPTDDKNIFTVSGRIRVKTSEFIGPRPGETAPVPAPPTAKNGIKTRSYIIILDTPTGWLNARKGPGISYASVARVHPGEKYVLLKEKDEWYYIDMEGEGGIKAWVSAQYAKKE